MLHNQIQCRQASKLYTCTLTCHVVTTSSQNHVRSWLDPYIDHSQQNLKLMSQKSQLKGKLKKNQTFIVNLSISIYISFSDHFVDFFIRQLLTEVCHHMS